MMQVYSKAQKSFKKLSLDSGSYRSIGCLMLPPPSGVQVLLPEGEAGPPAPRVLLPQPHGAEPDRGQGRGTRPTHHQVGRDRLTET